MTERCQRCGGHGEDRRTLWLACFYALEETGLPLEQVQIVGGVADKIGEHTIIESTGGIPAVKAPDFGEPGPSGKHRFYRLRICKNCRADFMAALRAWFKERHARESCGSGIFVRRDGATVEVTEEEWLRMQEAPTP